MLVASHSLSLRRLFVCIEALAAVLLSPLQFGFSQFVVCYGHSLVSTHTHGAVRTSTRTHTVNPTAGLVCHTGGGCVIG